MRFVISEYPGSYLSVSFEQGEKFITEKGALVIVDGEYLFETKIDVKGYKSWIAGLFGKSLTYNSYTAKESLKMIVSPKDDSELFQIDVCESSPILFEPNLHFARTAGLEIRLEKKDWKSTLNDGLKLKSSGKGNLFLKGYGKIIMQEIDSEKPVYIDEDALIAFEEKLEIRTISKGIKEVFTSGEGFVFSVKGHGKIWLQTRQTGRDSSGRGLAEGILGLIR